MQHIKSAGLVLFSVVATVIVMKQIDRMQLDQKRHDQIQQHHSVGNSASSPKVDPKQPILQSQENLSEKVDGIASNPELNPQQIVSHQKTKESAPLVIDINALVSNGSALDSSQVDHFIKVPHFNEFIEQLRYGQSHQEATREQELYELMLNEDELSQYVNNVSCGKNVCAIEVLNIQNEEASKVEESLRTALNFKAATMYYQLNDDGSFNARVIGGANDSVNAITAF